MGSMWVRPISLASIAVGFVLVVFGLLQDPGGEDRGPGLAVTSVTEAPTSSTPTTTPTTTTSSTTSSTTTTSSTVPPETLEEFVAVFDAALAAGDLDFVFSRLHPVVLDRYGEEACRAAVDTEIALISSYAIAGTPSEPTRASIGGVSVPEYVTVPITFNFRGQDVEAEGAFAPVEGLMYWFTQCE